MIETNLNDGVDPDYQAAIIEEIEFRKLMWDQLEINEKVIMKAYANNLNNNKNVHVKLSQAVQVIMDRYPDFDMSCVP